MPPPWILKFELFNGWMAQEGRTALAYQISPKSVKPRPRYGGFSKMAAVHHLGFVVGCVQATHEGHLMVFIAVQNLVGIGTVVWIICMFFDYASLASKCLFMPPKLGFWGILPPKWGAISTKSKKAHPCASLRRLSHHAQKSVDTSDL